MVNDKTFFEPDLTEAPAGVDRRAFLTAYDPTQDDENGTILARTMAAIKSERGVVEPQQERKKEDQVASSNSGRRAMPRTVSFFDSLFSGNRGFSPSPMPPRPVYRR